MHDTRRYERCPAPWVDRRGVAEFFPKDTSPTRTWRG